MLVVADVLPVVVSVLTTTLVTADVDIVASVPTPETVCLEVVDVISTEYFLIPCQWIILVVVAV